MHDTYQGSVKKTLEIWVDFDGSGKKSKSFSMEREPEGTDVIFYEDKGGYLFVSAGNAAVRDWSWARITTVISEVLTGGDTHVT